MLIQPSTGLIVAMAQSRPDMGDKDPGETYYNYNVERSMGGAEGYQAGSTFKTFTLAAALDQGMTPRNALQRPGTMPFKGMTFKNCTGPFVFKQDHTVRNYNRGYGQIDMIRAAEDSVNTYFLQLEADAGICASIDKAAAAGVKMSTGQDLRVNQNYPTFVLGTAEVTPLSMAEAYATFANRGIHCEPIILKSVERNDGTAVEVPSANCKQVIRQEVADGVNYILQSVALNGTGAPGPADRRPPPGGQDGHDQRQPGRLVRRLHPRDGRRGLDRDRQDQPLVRDQEQDAEERPPSQRHLPPRAPAAATRARSGRPRWHRPSRTSRRRPSRPPPPRCSRA